MIERQQQNKIHYLFAGIIVIGIIIKFLLLDFQYADYGFYLSRWIGEIKANGYLESLKDPFYNYTPAYMYVLVLIAKLDLYPLYAIKIISIIFDYILAFYVGRLAFLYWKSKRMMWVAFAIVPLIPTVLLNSGFMSQCDSIYASFALGSIYFLFTGRRWTAMFFLGIAFAFKIQTAMVLPFYFVYLLRGKIQWYYFLLIPVIYFVSIIPAWIVGRPLLDLLTIYGGQASYNTELVKNFANMYHWLESLGEIAKIIGLIVVLVLTLVTGYFLRNEKYRFTYDNWMRLLFLSTIICPFFLPGMLERYMYLGDVMAVLMAIISRRYILPALGVIFVSFYSYVRCIYMFSFGGDSLYPSSPFAIFEFIPWEVMSVLYLAIIVYMVYDFVKALSKNKKEPQVVPVRENKDSWYE